MTYKKYDQAVQNLLKASNSEALDHNREIREDDKSSSQQILEQKLVSFRLALKIGNGRFLDAEELKPEAAATDYLRAETYFVRGMVLVHKETLSDAALQFEAAAKDYLLSDNLEKALLSRFNALIAKSAGSLLTPQQELQSCNELRALAEENQVFKIQALCLRQKSYCYFASDRPLAAYQEILAALPLIERHCPVSDYHLALIHAADCAMESKDLEKAKIHLDYIPAEVDARIDFPRAYLMAKIEGTALDLDAFTDINSHWLARHKASLNRQNQNSLSTKPQAIWNTKTNLITNDKKQILGKIKPNSLEGLLLKMLMRGPQNKELLSETLWPEFSHTENLDDRFFRLKNRLNLKLGELIHFDGQNYFLTTNIKCK